MRSDVDETARVAVDPGMKGPLIYVQQPLASIEEQIRDWVKRVGDLKDATKALRAVINQRLMRALCPNCRQAYQPSPEQIKKLNLPAKKVGQLHRASGKVQVEDACAEIAKHVSQGGQVSDVMAANAFFPPMMKHMVKAGETTGNVDGMMNKIADFYDTECDATVAALTSLIEPMLIVFLGVVVGGIVMAMFLPIFQLGAVAGGMQ